MAAHTFFEVKKPHGGSLCRVQGTKHQVAGRYGFPGPFQVVIGTNCDGQNGACGAFVPEENKIEINRTILTDPKEVVDTIAHEMRHAYQHQRAEMLETWQDFLYRLNFENYISPVSLADGKYLFFTDYQDQLVEAEARAFANIFTHKEVA